MGSTWDLDSLRLAVLEIGSPGDLQSWRFATLEIGNSGDLQSWRLPIFESGNTGDWQSLRFRIVEIDLSASSNKRKASMEAALNSVWPKWFQNTRPWCQNIRLPGHQWFRNVNGSAHVTFAKSQTTARPHVWFLIRRNIFMCDSWFDVTHMLRKSKKSKSNQDSHMSTRHKISHDPPRVMSKTWTWKVGGWKRLFLLGCTGWLWAT